MAAVGEHASRMNVCIPGLGVGRSDRLDEIVAAAATK